MAKVKITPPLSQSFEGDSESISHSLFENLAPLISLKEAAELIQCSKRTLEDWRYKRSVPEEIFLKVKGRVLVHSKKFERWVLQSA